VKDVLDQIKSFFDRLGKKNIVIISAVLVLIIISIVFVTKMLKKDIKTVEQQKPQVDIQDLIAEEETLNFLVGDEVWGSSKEEIISKYSGSETKKILNDGENYISFDFVGVFGNETMPTYLFKDNKLVAILYERNVGDLEKDRLAIEHQDIASQIHLIFPEEYSEVFTWNVRAKKYDPNLWNEAVINGDLEMKSIWTGNKENIYLITTAYPKFDFLYKELDKKSNGYQAIIAVSKDYLINNNLESLYEIKP